jgi:hypothetical protein
LHVAAIFQAQGHPIAALTTSSSTLVFGTSNVPGRPSTTGSAWLLGASPKAVEAAVKI